MIMLANTDSYVITMTSLEIAELLEARHDNVKRTVERLANKGVIQLPPLEEVKNHLGQTVSHYRFSSEQGKRDSIIVVAQLSPEFTARLVDRWQELEAKIADPVLDPMSALSDPAVVRGWLLTYTERVISLEHQVKEMQPDVIAFHRIAKSEGGSCITDVAKDLQIRPKNLFNYLSANSWIYRRAGGKGWLAYQNKIQQGVLEHKVTTVSRSDGTEKIVERVLVTPKGLTALSKLLNRQEH